MKHTTFLKITAALTAFVFLCEPLSGFAFSLSPTSSVLGTPTPGILENARAGFDLEKNQNADAIRSKEKPFCFVIADPHGNINAAEKIFSFIHTFREANLNPVVLAEGFEGPLDTSGLDFSAPTSKREEIVRRWLRRGDLSPLGASLIIKPEPSDAFGLEDLSIYTQNLEAYWRVKKNSTEALGILTKFYEPLTSSLAAKLGDHRELLEVSNVEALLSRLTTQPEETIRLFKSAVERLPLAKTTGLDKTFPAVHLLFGSASTETSAEDVTRLHALFLQPAFLASLTREYPRFHRLLLREISGEPGQVHLFHARDHFSRLLSLELDNDTLGELNRMSASDKEAEFLSGVNASPALAAQEKTVFAETWANARTFYRLAESRDEIFVRKFEAIRKMFPERKVFILLMGGFHAKHVQATLEAGKYPYLIMKPKDIGTERDRYTEKMMALIKTPHATLMPPELLQAGSYASSLTEFSGAVNVLAHQRRLLAEELIPTAKETVVGFGRAISTWQRIGHFASRLSLGILPFVAACASSAQKAQLQQVGENLKPDTTAKSGESPLPPTKLDAALLSSNKLIIARINVAQAYLEWLKTQPAFRNWDLAASFATDWSKVIAGSTNKGRDKLNQLRRETLSNIADRIIAGVPIEQVASSLTAAKDRNLDLEGGAAEPVDYSPVWGDLGFSLALPTSPGFSLLDQIPVEGRSWMPLWGITTPVAEIGPTAANITTLSTDIQAALNLVREIAIYRQTLRDEASNTAELYRAVEHANLELTQLMLSAHLLDEEIRQAGSNTFKSNVKEKDIERLKHKLSELIALINRQITAVKLFQATVDLVFQNSINDVRSWVVQTGAGERSVFRLIGNANGIPIPEGWEHLPDVSFLTRSEGIYRLQPEQFSAFVQSLVARNIINPANAEWTGTWSVYQSAGAAETLDTENVLTEARKTLANVQQTSETRIEQVTIGIDEQTLRQSMLALHPQVTVGVDAGFTASSVKKFDTLSIGVPLSLSINLPLKQGNTRATMRQNELTIQLSGLAIEEARKTYKDKLGTFVDEVSQLMDDRNALTAKQAGIQSFLGELGRERNDYLSVGKPVPVTVERKFWSLIQDASALRAALNAVDINLFYKLWQIKILNGDHSGSLAPSVPENMDDYLERTVGREINKSGFGSDETASDVFLAEAARRLEMYRGQLPESGEMTFAGYRIQFTTSPSGGSIDALDIPFSSLNPEYARFGLILLEEELSRRALEQFTAASSPFSNEDERRYAHYADMLTRIVTRVRSAGLAQTLLDQADRESAAYTQSTRLRNILSILKKLDAYPKKVTADTVKRAVFLSLQEDVKVSHPAAERTSERVAPIAVPRTLKASRDLFRTLKSTLPAYRQKLYNAHGLNAAFYAEREISEAAQKRFQNMRKTDFEIRGLLDMILPLPMFETPPKSALASVRAYSLDEARTISSTFNIPGPKLSTYHRGLYRRAVKGDATSLTRLQNYGKNSIKDRAALVSHSERSEESQDETLRSAQGDNSNKILSTTSRFRRPSGIVSWAAAAVLGLGAFFFQNFLRAENSEANGRLNTPAAVSPKPEEETPPTPAPKPAWHSRARIEKNPGYPSTLLPWFALDTFERNPGFATRIQGKVVAVELPADVDWQKLEEFKTRWEALLTEPQGKAGEWRTEDRDLFTYPVDIGEWDGVRAAYDDAKAARRLLTVKPVEADGFRRDSVIRWKFLVDAIEEALQKAEREYDTWRRGDLDLGTFKTGFLFPAHTALRDLANAIETYASAHMVDLAGVSGLRSDSRPVRFGFILPISELENLNRLRIEVTDAAGNKKTLSQKDLRIVASLGDSDRLLIDVWADVDTLEVTHAEASFDLSGSFAPDAALPIYSGIGELIGVPAGNISGLVPFGTVVREGDPLFNVMHTGLEAAVRALEDKKKDLENQLAALPGSLTFTERDRLANEILLVEFEIETLASQRPDETFLAPVDGLFVPAPSGVGQIIPAKSYEDFETEQTPENRGFGIAATLWNAVSGSNTLWEHVPTVSLPWAARLRDAHLRHSFVGAFSDRFGSANLGRSLARRVSQPEPPSLASDILITDFASLSLKGFENWKTHLPDSPSFRWILLVSKSDAASPAFQAFHRTALPFHPQVIAYDDAPDYDRILSNVFRSPIAREAVVKMVVKDELKNLRLAAPLRRRLLATSFVQAVYGEFETLLYEELLRLDRPEDLRVHFGGSFSSSGTGFFQIDFMDLLKAQELILRAA